MSSRNDATSDNNGDDNPLQNNDDFYIYKRGKVDETDKKNIENVRIDRSVSVIDDGAFYKCEQLRTVSFSTNGNLKKIGNKSFRGYNNLFSINLQNTQVESIDIGAFFHCEELATVQFPGTIQKIERGCFAYCHQLKAVDLSHVNHLESIERYTFARCSALTTINLPPTTSCIGKASFYRCEALETVDLRATCITEIGVGAFYYCKNLTNIYFPTATECIGQKSFFRCEKLSCVDLHATSVERIGDYAFYECSNLQTINFPKTLKYIGEESFRDCGSLKYLNLQDTSIEKISDRAFFGCTNLAMVVGISTSHQEEDGQESTDDYGSMILPASLVEIGEDGFDECPVLQNHINNNMIHYECDVNRGGRQFLQRDHHHHHENNNDGDAKRRGKVYFSSLWPLILYRVMHEMELPIDEICPNDDNLSLYTKAGPLQRQASVAFYLLVHGVVADLLPKRSGNVQATTQKHKAAKASTRSLLGLTKKRKAEW